MNKKAVRWGLICFLTYIAAYMCRVNFSASLTSLSAARSLEYDGLGTAGAAFFAVYAVGQLINGFLGDQIHPVRFIMTAIVGTAICNIGVALSTGFVPILIFWAVNGYFQSIFWSTMIRLLSMVSDKSARGSTSAFISSAMPVGYFISWCVLAPCFSDRNVMLFFLVPAFVVLPMLAFWAGKSAYLPQGRAQTLASASLRRGITKTLKLASKEKLLLLLAMLICHGLIKEGIAFWIPTIIHGTLRSAMLTAAALALLPAANFSGTLMAKRLLKSWGEIPLRVVRLGFCLMLPLCALCLLPIGVFVLIPMCLISCLSYCINTVLLSFVPMQYQAQGVVSSLVGLFDCCSYMGAALSTYVLGGIIGTQGVQGMAFVWISAAGAGLMLLFFKQRQDRMQKQGTGRGAAV